MGRKVMWGLAAAAAVVLAILAVRGFPAVGSGTEATVVPAQRAQTTQLASNDVVLGDADAQAFLQSDAFDRVEAPIRRRNPRELKTVSREQFFVFAFGALHPAVITSQGGPSFANRKAWFDQ